jgi:hypothetical protein
MAGSYPAPLIRPLSKQETNPTASIFKPRGNSKYAMLYFDENGRRRKANGCTDKAESKRIANKLENEVALRREGLIDRRRRRLTRLSDHSIGQRRRVAPAANEGRTPDRDHRRTGFPRPANPHGESSRPARRLATTKLSAVLTYRAQRAIFEQGNIFPHSDLYVGCIGGAIVATKSAAHKRVTTEKPPKLVAPEKRLPASKAAPSKPSKTTASSDGSPAVTPTTKTRIPTAATRRALADLKAGRWTRYVDADDLFSKLDIKIG